MRATDPALEPTTIHRSWLADLDMSLAWARPEPSHDDGCWALLDAADRDAADCMRTAEARRLTVWSRALLRRVLSERWGAPPERWRTERGPRGRLLVTSPRVVHASLCHTKGLVVAATGKKVVGVDAEPLDRRVDRALLAPRVLHPSEQHLVASPEHFLGAWVAKEALSKALGEGLAMEFDSVRVSGSGGRLCFSSERRDLGPMRGKLTTWKNWQVAAVAAVE